LSELPYVLYRDGVINRPYAVSNVMVYGQVNDDSTTDIFEDDESLGSGVAATHTITLSPSGTKAFQLEKVHFAMNCTNAVTYTLYLLEDVIADAMTERRRCIFDSGGGLADDVDYMVTGSDNTKLPVPVFLDDVATLPFKINWSGAPGDTTGFVVVEGRLLVKE